MGIIYLFVSKFAGIGKMIAMKNCGSIAKGAKNSLLINIVRSVGCIPVALLICLFSGFRQMNSAGVLFCILSGVANAGLLFAWVLCAEKSSLCTIEIFCMIGGVVLPLLVSPFIFTGEIITLTQWIGALLLIPAAYCLTKKGSGKKNGFSPTTVALLLLACVSTALTVLSQKLFTTYGEGTSADFNLLTFIFCSLVLATVFLIMSLVKKGEKSSVLHLNSAKKHFIIYILIAIVMLYVAQYFSTVSSGLLSSAYFFPLSYAIGMPLTLFTDIIVYKEKPKISSMVGILLVIGSVILISLKI